MQDFSHFVNRGFFYNEKVEPISAHLFALDNVQWKTMRTKLTPVFTSGKMKTMFHSIVSLSKNLVEAVDNCVKNNQDIDIKEVSNYN